MELDFFIIISCESGGRIKHLDFFKDLLSSGGSPQCDSFNFM